MINRYVIIYEGETEIEFFNQIKTTIFESKKIQKCNKHKNKIIKGTINTRSIINTKKCCSSFYIIDKDKIKDETIFEHNKKINNNNGTLIISNPCIELIILSIFDNNLSNEIIYENKEIEDKLTKSLRSCGIINKKEKYSKKNLDDLKK